MYWNLSCQQFHEPDKQDLDPITISKHQALLFSVTMPSGIFAFNYSCFVLRNILQQMMNNILNNVLTMCFIPPRGFGSKAFSNTLLSQDPLVNCYHCLLPSIVMAPFWKTKGPDVSPNQSQGYTLGGMLLCLPNTTTLGGNTSRVSMQVRFLYQVTPSKRYQLATAMISG